MIGMINDTKWDNGGGLEELQIWADAAKPQVFLMQDVIEALSKEDKFLREKVGHSIDSDKLEQLRSISFVLGDVFDSLHNALNRFMKEMQQHELMRLADEYATVKTKTTSGGNSDE